MYKFQKKIKELELDESKLSVRLKERIAEILTSIGHAKTALGTATSERQKAEINKDIDDMDNDLVKEVVKYHKQIPRLEALRKGRENAQAKKNAAKNEPVAPPAQNAEPVADPVPEPVVVQANVIDPNAAADPVPEPKKEKEGSVLGTIVTVAAVLVLGFFGFNIIKDKIG